MDIYLKSYNSKSKEDVAEPKDELCLIQISGSNDQEEEKVQSLVLNPPGGLEINEPSVNKDTTPSFRVALPSASPLNLSGISRSREENFEQSFTQKAIIKSTSVIGERSGGYSRGNKRSMSICGAGINIISEGADNSRFQFNDNLDYLQDINTFNDVCLAGQT